MIEPVSHHIIPIYLFIDKRKFYSAHVRLIIIVIVHELHIGTSNQLIGLIVPKLPEIMLVDIEYRCQLTRFRVVDQLIPEIACATSQMQPIL